MTLMTSGDPDQAVRPWPVIFKYAGDSIWILHLYSFIIINHLLSFQLTIMIDIKLNIILSSTIGLQSIITCYEIIIPSMIKPLLR